MTLLPRPILINGASHPAQQFRLLVADLARDNEGITRGTDLKVTQLGTPGGSVQVATGTAVVRGRVNAFQGSYACANTSSSTVSISPTAGAGRSDMLILRVEDPEHEGSIDPATGNVCYFQVISNVASNATTIPDGRTGIPLARIDIPASTATITNAMIVDIRQIANPRTERKLWTQAPASLSTVITGTAGTYSYFSTAAGWNIPIPAWASVAKIRLDIGGLRLTTGAVFGDASATFGASLSMQAVNIDDNQSTTRRITHLNADTLTIPDAYRGTTQVLRARARGVAGNAGGISVDTASVLIADVAFEEAPR